MPSLEALRGLFPDLEILELVGAGGMGAVYKARQTRLNRLVALKVMLGVPGHEKDFALRFEREAQVLAHLNHPNIVTLYDFGEFTAERTGDAALFWFLMEYVDGTDLCQLIRSKELKPVAALSIVPQICAALQYAHDQGITHRDIKPANLLIDQHGVVKIADFGLAKMIGGADEEAMMNGLTQTGWSMGTPHYMAPEQWDHPEQVDHRADIYALGVVFYEMLTGERPSGIFEPPSKKSSPPVDKKLDSVVMRAMEKNPERRYQQAGEIGDDVTRISGANKRRHNEAATGESRKRSRLPLVVGLAAILGLSGWWLWKTGTEVPTTAGVRVSEALVSDAPKAAEWVPLYREQADLTPLFQSPAALYPEFHSHADLVQDPATGLKLIDDWLTPTITDVKVMLPSARNAGIRIRVKMSEPAKMDGSSLWLRSEDGGPAYTGHWRGIVKYPGAKRGEPEYLASRMNLEAKKVGDTFTLEFYAIGPHLICKYEGDVIRTVLPDATSQTGSRNFLIFRNPVSDIEFIDLDSLSEAEALSLAGVEAETTNLAKGVDPQAPLVPLDEMSGSTLPSTAKPGRLHAFGTMLKGKALDLSKFAAYDDFVDVAGTLGSWVALRANGETISSDGETDFQGIRRIVRNFPAVYPSFIDESGSLRFHPRQEMTLPDSVKGRVVLDAACGNQHGVVMLDGGEAVVFGKRYEEAVGDVSESGGQGTPQWPQPETAALQNVKAVAATYTHAATLHDDGTVSAWGWEGPVEWKAEPQMKSVRQITSSHDFLLLLDEAGQVWRFSLPRSAHPNQPSGSDGRVKLAAVEVARLRDSLWLGRDGFWAGQKTDQPVTDLLQSVTLRPETNFALTASVSGGQPFGYVMWIGSAAEEKKEIESKTSSAEQK